MKTKYEISAYPFMPGRCLWPSPVDVWRWEIWRNFDRTANGELGEYLHAYSNLSSSHTQEAAVLMASQAGSGEMKVGCNNVRPEEETGEKQAALPTWNEKRLILGEFHYSL